MIIEAMLIGGVLPGALVTALFLTLWWKRRGPGAAGSLPLWGAPLAVPLAMLPAEFLVRRGLPPAWPAAGIDRLIHAGAVVLLLGLFESRLGKRPLAGAAVRMVSAALALWLVLGVRMPDFWTPAQAAAWIGGYALLTAGIATVVDRVARADNGPGATGVLFVTANGLPPVLLQAGLAYLAQLSGGVVAAAGAALFVAALVPAFTLAGGGVTALVTLFSTLLLAGHYYAPDNIPLAQTLCLAVSPLAVLVMRIPRVARSAPGRRCVLAMVVCAIPVAIAAGLALTGGKPEPAEYQSDQ